MKSAASFLAIAVSLAAAPVVAQTTITIWGNDNPQPSATEILSAEFDAMRDDVVVEYRQIPFSDLNEEYMRAFATNSAPDILMVNTTDTHFYASSGVLLDLTDRIAASDIIDFDEIFPGYQAAVTFEGRIYEVPRGANTLMIYVNSAMAEAAGIDPVDAPESWTEFYDYAQRLTNADSRVFGIAFSAKNNQEGPWQWLPFARMAGAEWDRINEPGAVRALEMWRDFVVNGLASQEVLVWSQGDAADSFRAQRAAMVIQGSWDVANMVAAPFEWNLWMLPPEEVGGLRVSAAGDFTYAVAAASDAPDLAFEVIEYIYSQDNRIWNEFSRMPARAVSPENPNYPEAYEAFIGQLQYGRVLGPNARWNDVSVALQTAIQASLSGAAEPADALERAAAEIAAID